MILIQEKKGKGRKGKEREGKGRKGKGKEVEGVEGRAGKRLKLKQKDTATNIQVSTRTFQK